LIVTDTPKDVLARACNEEKKPLVTQPNALLQGQQRDYLVLLFNKHRFVSFL